MAAVHFREEQKVATFACPKCREDRIDMLVRHEDGVVECLACGHRYEFEEGDED